MKITKEINFWKEVDLELTSDDICMVLENEGEPQDILNSLNDVAQFMRGVPDCLIAKLTPSQRECVVKFFTDEVIKRFSS